MPSRSIMLLQEGLEEIDQLVEEAKRKNPVIYESARYSALDVILLEAEGDEQGFLDRTAAAIEKVKKLDKDILSITSTSLSPKTITVNFLGEIQNPGTYNLDVKPNVTADKIRKAMLPRIDRHACAQIVSD